MEEKIVEGLWDCVYCGADKIGGLQKYCPCCGHPQSKDVSFYLGKKKRYLTEEEISTVGCNPDWLCDYCTSLNNDKFKYCKNCGAERLSSNKDYFSMRQKNEPLYEKTPPEQENMPNNNEETLRAETNDVLETQNLLNVLDYLDSEEDEPLSFTDKAFQFITGSKIIKACGSILLVLLILTGLVSLFMPKEYNATLHEKLWEREIIIEEYKTVKESAWDAVPSGGRLLQTKNEIRSYNKVFSHYETKTRQVSERVLDGYDTNTYYTDNGNGTFTEHTTQTPRYRTEYRTETYQEPVYKDVLVYDTKYYYEIERWVYNRTEKSNGSNNEPVWAEFKLKENERVSDKNEKYVLSFYVDKKEKYYKYNCDSFEEYNTYSLNEDMKITVSAGMIVKIK